MCSFAGMDVQKYWFCALLALARSAVLFPPGALFPSQAQEAAYVCIRPGVAEVRLSAAGFVRLVYVKACIDRLKSCD
jgi:hypothetical protein